MSCTAPMVCMMKTAGGKDMIQKYVYGKPFPTEAVVEEVAQAAGVPVYGSIETGQGFCFTYQMEENDIVYGQRIEQAGILLYQRLHG